MTQPVVYERECPHSFTASVCPVCLHFGKIRRAEYDGNDDLAKSYTECLRVIRQRKAAGGKGWEPV